MQTVEVVDTVNAPVSEGQVLGTIAYSLNGNEIGRVNIVADKSVSKNSAFNVIEHVIFNWFSLLRYSK